MELVNIKNPFQRDEKEVTALVHSNQSVEDIIVYHLDKIKKDHCYDITLETAKEVLRISIDGGIIPPEQWAFVRPSATSQIVVMPYVAGGEGAKSILTAFLIVGSIITGGALLTAAGFVQGSVGYSLAMMGISLGAGFLVRAITPTPEVDNFGEAEAPNVYSWTPQTIQKQGVAVPKFYGRNKLFGNVLSTYTSVGADNEAHQFLNFVIALGEGPVGGIVLAKIKINDQPYGNYRDIEVEEKKGTLDQTVISLFDNNKIEYVVNRLVKNSTGAEEYTIPDTDFDDLEIEILLSRGLYFTNKRGGISPTTVGIQIDIKENAGEYQTLFAGYIGVKKSGSNYSIILNSTAYGEAGITHPIRKIFTASETYVGGAPVTITKGNSYTIKVTKQTNDMDEARYGEYVAIGAIREILDETFAYPKTALVAVKALATDQISGSLSASFIQDGAIIQTTTDGVTWSFSASSNPAWILYDILTQPLISGDGDTEAYAVERYDGIDPDRLDLTSFIEFATFCDELVSDGNEGTEKRFTFNGGFDTTTSVWEAALKVCESARCGMVWNGSEITLVIDKAADPVQMFTISNIIKDSFKETFMAQSDLAAEMEIQYRDANQDYERVPFTIYDSAIDTGGSKVTIELFGVTKQSEAWRIGKNRLAMNRLVKSTVAFDVDIDAIACTVGDVIYVQHDVPEWGTGGRVFKGSIYWFIANRDLEYTEDEIHQVIVRLDDDTLNQRVCSSKYNPITGINLTDSIIEIAGNYTNEYKKDDRLRVVDSTGNDGYYYVSKDATYADGTTTITVRAAGLVAGDIVGGDILATKTEGIFEQVAAWPMTTGEDQVATITGGTFELQDEDVTTVGLSSAVADGGIYNLRRVVVTSPFLNASDEQAGPGYGNVFTFGIQNLEAKLFRIVSLQKTTDQIVSVIATEYNEDVYSESDDPEITPTQGVVAPETGRGGQRQWELPWNEIQRRYPDSIVLDPPSLDTPQLSGITFSNGENGLVPWSSGIITYKGAQYIIEEGSGDTNKFIYWDANNNPTTLLTTNLQSDGIGPGRFILCVNNSGTAFPVGATKLYWGELLITETLSALAAQLGDVLAGSITGTTILGGVFRTATSGRRVQIDQDGLKLLYAASAGLIGTAENGGSDLICGPLITTTITGITNDSSAVITCDASELSIGMKMKIVDVVGMEEINYTNAGVLEILDINSAETEITVDFDATESGIGTYDSDGTIQVGTNAICGAGVLAKIGNTGNSIPFEIVSEQMSLADLHLYPRATDPTTGKAGDIALVNNKLRVCTDSTPTWIDL